MSIYKRSISGMKNSGAYQNRAFDPFVDSITMLGNRLEKSSPLTDSDYPFRRLFDIIAASLALIILSPVILFAALLIKLESKGPVFYKQERIGLNRRNGDRRNRSDIDGGDTLRDRRSGRDRRQNSEAGKPFVMFKLRTMKTDAEKHGPVLASANDSRITRVGRILRKTRVDELPQFINVIKGDMTLIGPRPERSFYIKALSRDVPEFPLRLKTKPGITGLAQVESGYADTIEAMKTKLMYDLNYIMTKSFLQDIAIVLKTFYVVVSGRGAQ
ncbi:MAG: sugar transferase [Candidatus Latescibacteria bacterium]|nr:sugar transferase [bacterium]MBD3422938.1 sugar transferase [Candidatus Latescibacterota bacterium]